MLGLDFTTKMLVCIMEVVEFDQYHRLVLVFPGMIPLIYKNKIKNIYYLEKDDFLKVKNDSMERDEVIDSYTILKENIFNLPIDETIYSYYELEEKLSLVKGHHIVL